MFHLKKEYIMIDLLVLGAVAVAALCDSDSKKSNATKKTNKRKERRARRNDSWLDAAWFHDHNQSL